MSLHSGPAMPMVPPRHGGMRARREGTLAHLATGLAAFTAAVAVCVVAAVAVAVAIT